jgi:hypothetical protein
MLTWRCASGRKPTEVAVHFGFGCLLSLVLNMLLRLPLVLLLLRFRQAASAPLRVGVVGGGIGGASTVHYLRQKLEDGVDIQL